MEMEAQITPTLYGNLIYTKTWGQEDATNAGVYSFPADSGGEVSLVYKPSDTNIYANGGAVYVDGKYYVLTHVSNGNKVQKNTLYVYDVNDWSLLEQKDAPLTLSASDLTWCPVDNKVYGVFTKATASGYEFGTLDLDNLTVEKIKDLDLSDNIGPMAMLGLAANTDGDIYGVGPDGNLYRFDRLTGDHTLVGSTGFVPSRWNMSACFDFTTKEMYWAACNLERSALFKLDLATGAATAVREFANEEEFVGLFSLSSVADLEGPQIVEDFQVSLEGPALNGTVSFTLPVTAISGKTLEGTLDYIVNDNGAVLFHGTAAPGAAVSRDIDFAQGVHAIEAYATAAGARGASVRKTVYAGNDIPAVPTGLKAEKDGDAVKLTWNAVTTGAHKGYVDPAAVTYTVVRMPGAVYVAQGIAATECTDSELPVSLGDYTYEVKALFAGKAGGVAVSEPITLGSLINPPVAYDLTNEGEFKFFTVLDANRDGNTWKWSANGAFCQYDRNNASDDWLFSPALNLKGDHQYVITLEMRSGNNNRAETYEIMAGNAATVEAMTIPVLENGSVANNKRHPESIIFTPEADGVYNIGIHCTSPKYQYNLYVYTFDISAPVSVKAPVASDNVSAAAAEGGVLEATIKAVAPTKAVDGSDISAFEKAEFTNLTTGKVVGVVETPAPGAEVIAVDKEAVTGINTYSVAFFNEAGKGYAATTEAYVGEDVPMPVSNVVLRQEGDKAVLTWEAPTEGVNGGYINPANLRYRVALVSNNADVAANLDQCTYTDATQDVAVQHALQYTVFASSLAGEGSGYKSNMLIFGNPYPAPYAESFASGQLQTEPWSTVRGDDAGYPDWTATKKTMYDDTDPSQDGDLGWMKYSGKGTITLQSPIVDISSCSNPVLKFWYRANAGNSAAVPFQVLVSTNRGETWSPASSLPVTSTEWKQHAISLASYKDAASLQIAFKGASQDYDEMYLDNIRIFDVLGNDLGIKSFSGPTKLEAGTAAKYSVGIINDGLSAASGYTITINGNDIELAKVYGPALASEEAAVVDIDVAIPGNFTNTVLTAKIDFAADENLANNESTLEIEASVPRLPLIDTLVATADGSAVKLTWTRAAEQRNPSATLDDLESLTPWDFGGVTATNPTGTIGNFTVYDADGKNTVIAASYFKQDNGGNPMAFQVNKNGEPYPALDLKTYSINSHSGTQSLIAWGAVEGASSDWLILPELFPGETTISFWAHATPMGYGASPSEKLDVYYSTTGNDISDFTAFAEGVDVPAGLQSDSENGFHFFEYTLPEDAKYAAVRISLSTNMNKSVVIDDISYTAASSPIELLEIKGYNIYRDGVKIGTSDTEEYIDTPEEGTHAYNVTTRYHLGESAFSNEASAIALGIEDVAVGDASGEYRFFTIQGFEVKNPTRGNIYIVVAPDGTTSKRIIR